MRIQARIAAITVAVALPQLVGLVWWDGLSRQAAAQAALRGMLTRVLDEPQAQERCLADPAAWREGLRPRHHGPPPPRDGEHRAPPSGRDHPPRPAPPNGPPPGGRPRIEPPRLAMWSLDGTPSDPEAGPLTVDPDTLVHGDIVPGATSAWSSKVEVITRTGWGGACEVMAVRGSTAPGFLGSVLPSTPVWILPTFLVATVMWLAVAPPVRRLRRLTQAVREGVHPIASEGTDEIAELSQAFDAAIRAREAEASARREREAALRTFVAHTAHDVRIPLTVLQGHLTALETAEAPGAVQGALTEVQYLRSLLDNLAARARMDAGDPPCAIDLRTLVERVVSRHRPLARRAGVDLGWGVPEAAVPVLADLTLAEQALSNLVFNAIRHHREAGHVAVTLDVDGDQFELSVVDDGPGVPADELPKLVERGFRGSSARRRDVPGDGLGLEIVADVADKHGWTLTLTTTDPHGLTATLAGPVHPTLEDEPFTSP